MIPGFPLPAYTSVRVSACYSYQKDRRVKPGKLRNIRYFANRGGWIESPVLIIIFIAIRLFQDTKDDGKTGKKAKLPQTSGNQCFLASVRKLWQTQWHWGWFYSDHSSSTLSKLFHQLSILIYTFKETLNVTKKQKKTVNIPTDDILLRKSGNIQKGKYFHSTTLFSPWRVKHKLLCFTYPLIV